ncbi:hypothetical protein F5B22DRAFT_75439 [Xylaria bambusicola]|uniref:uncharacterized protein n=1 Tax=Xylaria bambusicola TaxID=326684 RepID=UPI0020076398|nr:uncharacterized protein F5B22DRAFT_75439 [Xylaria bambusicola]KAI0518187.1 hypothetical protein F5B22DRAFT_75439 [Xylaria bambusicola]
MRWCKTRTSPETTGGGLVYTTSNAYYACVYTGVTMYKDRRLLLVQHNSPTRHFAHRTTLIDYRPRHSHGAKEFLGTAYHISWTRELFLLGRTSSLIRRFAGQGLFRSASEGRASRDKSLHVPRANRQSKPTRPNDPSRQTGDSPIDTLYPSRPEVPNIAVGFYASLALRGKTGERHARTCSSPCTYMTCILNLEIYMLHIIAHVFRPGVLSR